MSKVFLSYSRRDEHFVKELYRKLTGDGVDCFFDKESNAWNANRVVELENGLDECEVVVLVLSPDFRRSEWPKIESTSSMVDDPAGFRGKLRPLLLGPCAEDLSRFLRACQHIDVSTVDKFEEAYPEICRELGGTVTEKDQTVDRNRLPPVRKLPKRHRMPYRSLGNRFAGRIKTLWDIHDMLQGRKTELVERVGVIMGTGGIGKTQLAIEYVHRFGTDYPGGVFWINAEQGLSEYVPHVTRGADIVIDGTFEEHYQLEQMWRMLTGFGPVLIVLDNFSEGEALQPWLPPTGVFHTLVTTRRRDLSYSRLSLDSMTEEEAFELLNSGERGFGLEAGKLNDTLGGLPLALALVRNFLNQRPALTIEGLLQEIKKTGEIQTLCIFVEKYADELPSGHSRDVAAAFKISWDFASSTAKAVLQFISFLGPVPVPRRLLRKFIDFPSRSAIEVSLDEAINELASKLSLTELDDDNDPLVHQLISAFVRETTDAPDNLSESVGRAVEEEMARIADESDILSYIQLEKILPHAELLTSPEDINTEQAIDFANYLCILLSLVPVQKSGKFRFDFPKKIVFRWQQP